MLVLSLFFGLQLCAVLLVLGSSLGRVVSVIAETPTKFQEATLALFTELQPFMLVSF